MIDRTALSTAYDGALRGAYDEINALANLCGRWGLDPVHPLPLALGSVLSGWQSYEQQPWWFDAHTDDLSAQDESWFYIGKALWRRPAPPTGNGG
jgi:hypothetical protein